MARTTIQRPPRQNGDDRICSGMRSIHPVLGRYSHLLQSHRCHLLGHLLGTRHYRCRRWPTMAHLKRHLPSLTQVTRPPRQAAQKHEACSTPTVSAWSSDFSPITPPVATGHEPRSRSHQHVLPHCPGSRRTQLGCATPWANCEHVLGNIAQPVRLVNPLLRHATAVPSAWPSRVERSGGQCRALSMRYELRTICV